MGYLWIDYLKYKQKYLKYKQFFADWNCNHILDSLPHTNLFSKSSNQPIENAKNDDSRL